MFEALDARLSSWLMPTKSASELELQQQAREAKAGDELAEALESLAERDQKKVSQGMVLLNALKAKKPIKSKEENNQNDP